MQPAYGWCRRAAEHNVWSQQQFRAQQFSASHTAQCPAARLLLPADPDSYLFPAKWGWCTCLWGRSIMQWTPPHLRVVAENVTTVTWNQALSSHRGFYLFPYKDATATGRIKVVCTCFTAKWPYLMTWILKALTYAAGFSLSRPEHMLAGCCISDVAACQGYQLKKPSL